MVNNLELAVAGSGKTHRLVEYCASTAPDRSMAILAFTQANQAELRQRLRARAGSRSKTEVLGWFAFLLAHFARPFIPFKFPSQRVRGFNFDGRPSRFATGQARFMDSNGAVYACELGRLASELIGASGGALQRRLQAIFDEILIDEVQDLSAHDWDILDFLLASNIDVRMVGDVRQAVVATNPRSSKHNKYAYAGAYDWFREREEAGTLTIAHSCITRRCRPEIAEFADTIFADVLDLPPTESENATETGHDGVFLIHPRDIDSYLAAFGPRCLRHSVSSGKMFDLNFMNFKASKGTEYERVLIVPTGGIKKFIQSGVPLGAGPAATFYVATTRARQSVAIVIDKAGTSSIPWWTP